jgi:drug/metabolite transporter (DMT)-like permease
VQLFSILASYLGVLLITNPELFREEARIRMLTSINLSAFLKANGFSIFMAMAACVFNAFNYLAARRMSSQIHPCIETMYIGIV